MTKSELIKGIQNEVSINIPQKEQVYDHKHTNRQNKTAFSPYFIQLIKYQSMHPALPPQISSYKVLQDHLHFHIYCKDFRLYLCQ